MAATLDDKGGFYILPTTAQRAGVITYRGDTVPDAARPPSTTALGTVYPFAQEGDIWIKVDGSTYILTNTVWVKQ